MCGRDKTGLQAPSDTGGGHGFEESGHKIAIVTLKNAARVGRRVSIEQIEYDILRQALSVWSSKRGSRRFPARGDIAPRDLAPFLQNVTLYRVIDDGSDFEYRVMGDAAVVAWGRSFQGMGRRDLNALQPGMGDVVARVFLWIVRKREPLVMRGLLQKGIVDARHQETIFLPLGENDSTIDHILSVGIYVPQSLDELTFDPDYDDAP